MLISTYLHHLNQYRQDREAILKLSAFFKTQSASLEVGVSYNERSFQIWQQEKFLIKQGSRLLKNVGLDVADLNVYETAEPLAYYSHSKQTPQNILIIGEEFLQSGAADLIGVGRAMLADHRWAEKQMS